MDGATAPAGEPAGPVRQFMINYKAAKCLTLGTANPNGTTAVVLGSCDQTGESPWQYWKGYTQANPLAS